MKAKSKAKGALIKVGLIFGGSYLGCLVLVIALLGSGGMSGGGLPIVVDEELAYDYQYVCSELGIPWDIVLLSDVLFAQQNNEDFVGDIYPMYTALQFCIVTERHLIRFEEEITDPNTGNVTYDEWWEESPENVVYHGMEEIIGYMEVDEEWLEGTTMSDLLEQLEDICESKSDEDNRYEAEITINPETELILRDYIGLNDSNCNTVMQLHDAQYMAMLYGFVYETGEIPLPELVIGNVSRSELAQVAVSILGHPYLMGGKSPAIGAPTGPLDCSGFVDWVYIQCFGTGVSGGGVPEGIAVSGTALQWYASTAISESELQVGDLAFLYDPATLETGRVNHVGIYIGSVGDTKYFVHCAGRYYGTDSLPSGRVGISTKRGENSYNCVTGESFAPPMKSCSFRYFRRPNFSFVDD